MLTRRLFLKRTALATSTLTAARLLPAPSLFAAGSPIDKLNCAVIGCGGRGLSAHIDWIVKASKDNVVAIVDPDEKRQDEVKKWLTKKEMDAGKLQTFADYRVMFDKIASQIDAVFVAAPNHHHAPASIRALQAGKGIYCEKPLCHDIAEARKLREMAAQS